MMYRQKGNNPNNAREESRIGARSQPHNGKLSTIARHVHGHSPVRGVGDIAQVQKGGSVYVVTRDHVGTIWSLLDSSGAKANMYSCDACGVRTPNPPGATQWAKAAGS